MVDAAKDITSEKNTTLPDIGETEALCNDLKHILVRSEQALIKGDAKDSIEKVERWIESYRRGLSAAQKISDSGSEILKKARDQLALSLEELLRLEGEGGNLAPSTDRANDSEEITRAIKRIDKLMPVVERSFQPLSSESEKLNN